MTANPYEYHEVAEPVKPVETSPPLGLDPQLAGFFASVAISSPIGGLAMGLRAGSAWAAPGGLLVGLVCGLIASAITFPFVGVACRRLELEESTSAACAVGSAVTNGGLWFILLTVLELSRVRAAGGMFVAVLSAAVTGLAVLHCESKRTVAQTDSDKFRV